MAASVCFYNDVDCLARCLDSLKEFDHVYCVDGKYLEHELVNNDPLSTDGSREVVLQHPNCRLIDAPNLPQPRVRDRYMEVATADGCDFLLGLDATEYVTGDLQIFRRNLECYNDSMPRQLAVAYDDLNRLEFTDLFNSPKLLYRPDKIRYGRNHNSLIIDGREVLIHSGMKRRVPVEGLVIKSDITLRKPADHERMHRYRNRMNESEYAVRHELKAASLVI